MHMTPLLRRAIIALAVSALIFLVVGQFTDIDLMIEDYFYDETLKIFPWKNNWFAKDFMHGSVKHVIIKSGYLLIFLVLMDAIFNFKIVSPFVRIRLRFIALASILVPFVIRSIKEFSVLHCPWSIDRYGGNAAFLRLLESVPAGVNAGHCFPAGHATVGLWLAALCVFWLPAKPKAALFVFLAGLGVGILLG